MKFETKECLNNFFCTIGVLRYFESNVLDGWSLTICAQNYTQVDFCLTIDV